MSLMSHVKQYHTGNRLPERWIGSAFHTLFKNENKNVAKDRRRSQAAAKARGEPSKEARRVRQKPEMTRLLDTLQAKANEALTRGDKKSFEYMYKKARDLRKQIGLPLEEQPANIKQLIDPPGTGSSQSYSDRTLTFGGSASSQGDGSQRTACDPDIDFRVCIREPAVSFQLIPDEQLENSDARKNYSWPMSSTSGLDLSDVKEFVVSRTKSTGTAYSHMSGIEYFFSLFEVSNPTVSLLALYKKLYSEGLVSQVMRLSILSPSIPWTHKIASGLAVLMDYISIMAEERMDDVGYRMADNFRRRFLVPIIKRLPAANKVSRHRRKNIDNRRRLKLPTLDQQGEAMNWTIIDLNILCDEFLPSFLATGYCHPRIRQIINANTVALYMYRTYPGRPGELDKFPLKSMQEWGAYLSRLRFQITHEALNEFDSVAFGVDHTGMIAHALDSKFPNGNIVDLGFVIDRVPSDTDFVGCGSVVCQIGWLAI